MGAKKKYARWMNGREICKISQRRAGRREKWKNGRGVGIRETEGNRNR